MSIKHQVYRHKQEQRIYQGRLLILFIICAVLALCLITRLAILQVTEHQHYSTLSKKNRLNYLSIAPKRGLIYDRNHIIIADNRPAFTLNIIKNRTPNIKQTIEKINHFTHLNRSDLEYFYKQIKTHRPFQPIPLKYHLSEQEVAILYANLFKIPGISISADLERYYPKGKMLTPVLGYLGRINHQDLIDRDKKNYAVTPFIGKTGIEHYYEAILHGAVGYQTIEVNVSGAPQRTLQRQEPIPGHDITLTIDAHLQQAAYQALKNVNGAIVAINPQNGDILSLVSTPSFNNNLFSHGISKKQYLKLINDPDLPLFNRALNGQFPPASTFKPFIALAALEQDWITPKTTIVDHGTFRIPHTSHIYRDWLKQGHGTVNITQAIILSCDVFFYKLGVQMGMHSVLPLLKQFGFGQTIDLDTDSLSNGVLSSPHWKKQHKNKPWYTGDTIISYIGQGSMLSTPIQLAQATSLLAMRGQGFKPHLLKSISGTQHSYQYKPRRTPPIQLSQETWDTVIHAMHEVIFSPLPMATGWRFGHPPYPVAAKTGTAQVIHDERKSKQLNIAKRLRDHSWFIGFAPIKKPAIAIAVICEHSGQAAKIARQVMDAYLLKK